MNNKKKKKQNGFTIVELVIVIAVIGILSAVLIPTFSNLVKKSKQSADQQLVYHINEAVIANEVDNLAKGKSGTEATMYDTLKKLESDYGFTVEKMTPRSGNDIVWDSTTNRFVLVAKDNKVVYTDPNNPSKMANKAKMWRITEAGETLGDGYAHYLTAGWSGVVPTVSTGLDVGDNDDITSVNYARTATTEVPTQTVVIRTNGGNLTVDAPKDTVYHYEKADLVDIKSVDSNASYHEHGEVSLAKIANGRIVVTEEAKIGGIHAVATEDKFNDIKVAVVGNTEVPSITRDAVSEDSKTEEGTYTKFVLEVQTIATETTIEDSSEYVWINVVVDGEGVATTSTEVATSKTTLNEETKISEASQSAAATAIKSSVEEARDADEVELEKVIFEIKTVNDLKTFISANGTKYNKGKLMNDLTIEDLLKIEKNIILDLNGNKLVNMATGGRFLELANSISAEINGTTEGSGMEIPLSNENSYGFFKVSNTSTLILNGGEYTGYTNNGAFIRPDNGSYSIENNHYVFSGAQIELNNLNCRTNYRFVASGSNTYATISINGGKFIQDNTGLTAPGGTIPAFWFCGYLDAQITDVKVVSDIGSCMSFNNSDVVLNGNNDFYVKNENSIQTWNMTAVSLENFATVTVNDGNYSSRVGYGAYVFTSGGRLFINGGTFEGAAAALKCDFDSNSYANGRRYACTIINGGTFNGSKSTNGNDYATIVEADYSAISINEDGITATGELKLLINGTEYRYNLENAQLQSWENGTDYLFDFTNGTVNYQIDLDISTDYESGMNLYFTFIPEQS